MSRSWALLRERYFWYELLDIHQFIHTVLQLENNRTEEWNNSNNQSMFK